MIFQKTLGAGIVLENNGTALVKATVNIEPSDTEALPFVDQTLLWDFQIETDAGDIYTVLSGTFIVGATVTRDIA
jgi:hypothetical protein